MILHENKDIFYNIILNTSSFYKIHPSLVEKDYFVSLVLKKLSCFAPALIFKGGTSLSKCYKIIDRFSEDIDLTLDESFLGVGNKKRFKKSIVSVCEELGFSITNIEETRSRRDYNCYKINYPHRYEINAIKSMLLIETTYISKSYPCEDKFVSSLIYEYLLQNNNIEVINKYEMEPFKIRAQKLDRTLIDKVFAISDYYIDNKIYRNSRHLYDISKILPHIEFNDEFKKLIIKVRNERKNNTKCYSAQDNVSINNLLNAIINKEIFKKDYEELTSLMLYKEYSYENVVLSLKKIIESNYFI